MDRCEMLMDQMGAVYVKSDRIAALYVTKRVSFCWPHVEPASAKDGESLPSSPGNVVHVGAEGESGVEGHSENFGPLLHWKISVVQWD